MLNTRIVNRVAADIAFAVPAERLHDVLARGSGFVAVIPAERSGNAADKGSDHEGQGRQD
jgi:hypothetical protein